MNASRSSISVKGLKRFGSITKILIKHGLGDLVERVFKREGRKHRSLKHKDLFGPGFISPKRIRLVLEELGPSYIKLGQMMSTRADIFPPEYIEELKKLQDNVPPIPFEEIRQTIERELKCPIAELFEAFESASIAAASVSQVHTAKLHSGEKVAVKVVRPGIEKIIKEDIHLMHYFADKIEKAFELGRVIGISNVVEEFDRLIFKELDMFIEAGNIEKFSNNFRDIDTIYIPKVYWRFTTKSVLVMEHIEGIKMDQVDMLKAHGIDPREIAMIGLHAFCRQLMEVGFFHADPHPANTIVMYDGRVSLIDFGITGYLDGETMLQLANLLLGFAEHDYDMVMEGLLDMGLIDEETVDLKNFRVDLKGVVEPFFGRSLLTISVKDVYDQAIALVLKYHVRVPRNLLLLSKTFMQTEALGKILGSDLSLLEVSKPYAQKFIARGYDARKLIKDFGKDSLFMGKTIRTVPRLVHQILRQFAKGTPRIELWHTGFQRIDVKFEKSVNRLIIGLIISASIIAAALVLNSTQRILEVELNFFGHHMISVTSLLGLIGYSIATILGIWLIIMIFRSGKL